MSDIQSKASANWQGTIKEGKGTISANSHAFDNLPYTYQTRFENKPGTNPEEMIAAAHAACFSMKLSGILTEAGHPPTHIHTEARVTMSISKNGPKVSRSHLITEATVPGIDNAQFQKFANQSKETCPISALLSPGLDEITMEARLLT